MDFNFKIVIDKDGYPSTILIHDSNKVISKPYHPLELNIYEVQRIYEGIKDVVAYYEKWCILHEKKQYGKFSNDNKENTRLFIGAVQKLAKEFPDLTRDWIWNLEQS